MNKKKRSDKTALMIAGAAATTVISAGLVFAGIMLSPADDAVQVQQSAALTSMTPTDTGDEKEHTSGNREDSNKYHIEFTEEDIPVSVTHTEPSASGTSVPETSETTASETFAATDTEAPAGNTARTSDTAVSTGNTARTSDTSAPADTTAGTSAAQETDTSSAAETTAAETAAPQYTSYDKTYFANDLFIGDSIYTGLYLYEYFPQSQVFAKVGLNPESARTATVNGITVRSTVSGMKPARIFIMLGSNGLAYMSASGMAENIKSLAGELKEESPGSSIYIVSIPPVTYEHELKGQETMAMVNRYNGLLKTAAGECGAEYLDLCSSLMNDSGYFSSKYAEADGLHFLGSAYKLMLAFFQAETQ